MLISEFYELFGYRTPAAEWASILAFFVSLYAAVTITRVRKQILGRVRLPNLLELIKNDAHNIVKLMPDYDERRDEVGLELRKCEAHLKALLRSVPRKDKISTGTVLKRIREYNGQRYFIFSIRPKNNRDDAWEIYTVLNALIEELKVILEDQRLGGA
jgi:hypothetical protein